MELAKVMSKGQITLPKEVRDKLKVREGDKIVFLQKQGGFFMANADHLTVDREKIAAAGKAALAKVQNAFEGEADRLGIKTIDDVVKMVKEVRAEIR